MCEYSIEKVKALRDYAKQRGFSAPEGFWESPIEEVQRIYNGVGPDRWSAGFRKAITWLLKDLEAAAVIHDWGYVHCPKKYWNFSVENLRLGWNALKDHRTKIALPAALLCQIAGWSGYKEGK